MTLKEKIKELANNKGLSLPALESELGFGNGTILKWDKSTPNADKLLKVAEYFHVSVDYLLGREDNNKLQLNARDKKDIAKSLEEVMSNLESKGATAYGGEIDEEDKELYRLAIQNALEVIKIKNKEKYTPKKYRK